MLLPTPEQSASASHSRKDIQALRALAVTLVVAFHLFPQAVPSGFVGVDAFFVISGFLITSHLRRDVERSGRVDLVGFWAARARRLLPASFTVLAVCLLGTVALVPLSYQADFLEDIAAATFYALNWALAADAVDYWAAESSATVVQHFWSLSVEEQFYLVWPLLLVLAVRFRGSSGGRLLGARWLVGAVIALSLGISVSTGFRTDPADYFRTWHRAWEFGAGGFLALANRPIGFSARASGLAWLGLGMITAAAWLLPTQIAFPGYWALWPVSGTLLALWFGGGTERRWDVTVLLGGRPVQWVGDASYSIYLWHWPLIAGYRTVTGRTIGIPAACTLVLATIVLSALTKVFIEDPVRHGTFLRQRRPLFTFALTALAMAVLGLSTRRAFEAQAAVTTLRHPLAERMRKEIIPCFGGYRPAHCKNAEVEGRVLPTPSAALADKGRFCMANNRGDVRLRDCPRGARKKLRIRTALVGDSHSAHYLPMLEFGAAQRRERIQQFLKGSCPLSVSARDGSEELRTSCEVFKARVRERLRDGKFDRIAMSASSRNELVPRPGLPRFESAVLGYMEEIERLPASVREVIVFRDVPRQRGDVVQCLERLGSDAARLAHGVCSRRREAALLPDPLAEAARRLGGRVHLIDFTDTFCDSKICSPVVGNALVYRDQHHLTETFALTLTPQYTRELREFAHALTPAKSAPVMR